MKTLKISKTPQGIAEVILNRADVRNAFNPVMIEEITETFAALSADPSVRVVILKGDGKVFCAGADLSWMQSMVNFNLAENKQDSLKLFEMFESILNLKHPLITVVQGAAFGGALGIIAASDVVISAPDTKFCFSEVKLGIAPAVISTFILNKVSLAMLQPYMLSGKVFDTSTALRSGLVTESAQDLQDSVNQWTATFLEASPEAVVATKKLVNSLNNYAWSGQKELTTDLIANLRISEQGQAGLKAFLDKSNPPWKIQ